MLVQKDFLKQIKNSFRLNIYEVKIWTALLSKGVAAAGELSDISGVPRSRSYDVLESLERKGFIIMKIGKPIKYIAVQPEEIMQRVKRGLQEDAEQRMEFVDNIKKTDIFRELELLHKSGPEHFDITQLSDSIVGRANITPFIKKMIENAENTVTIVTTQDGFKRKAKILKSLSNKISKNKLKVRLIAPIDNEIAKKLTNVELKDAKTNVRFINVDDKEILVMISEENVDPDYDIGVWVKSEFFVNTINTLFEDILK